MWRSHAFPTLLLAALIACGGDPFQGGEDSGHPEPASDSGHAGETSTMPDAATADGPLEVATDGNLAGEVASANTFEDAEAGAACPDAGCLCVVASPPDCPAGWPYVPHGGGACCNYPAR